MDGSKLEPRDSDSRLMMIAIDSMSLPFLQRHLTELPTLRMLVDRGVMIEPETPAGHFSAAVWASFASGLPPGAHGQYFPFQWNAQHHVFRRLSKPIWKGAFVFEPFWHDIARAGVETTVLDAGSILNDAAAPCRQITNWSYQSTGDAAASDANLLKELRRRFGRRPIGKEVPVPKRRAACRRIRDEMIFALEHKTDAILWLMRRDPWRFFLAGYYEIHRAGHNLWPVEGEFASQADPEAMLDVYRAQDRQLGRLIEQLDSTATLVVFALNSMAPNVAQDHFLQRIMARLNASYLRERGVMTTSTHANLFSVLRKAVPYELQHYLAGLLGEDVQDWIVNRSLVGGLDWSMTPAFRIASGGEGMIRLNVKGREAKGFFEPASKDLANYVDWLRKRLLAIRVAGTDEPLIVDVLQTNDIFTGPMAHYLPDLLLKWGPDAPAEKIYSDEIGMIEERLATGRGGNHVDGSFMLVCGPRANDSLVREIARIEDIGAFVRRSFGLSAAAA